MLALEFRFPTGRYHATPWGRQVNEADVAWPPEPWRILRALIAAYWRKAERDRFPPDALAALIDRLAESAPEYALPDSAVHAHSRHYMPLASGRTTLVFDAFARFPASEPVVAVWPALELDAGALALAHHLAERIGYLGRAESWAECRVWSEAGPWTINARPAGPGAGAPGQEAVRLIAPLAPAAYAARRVDLIEAARGRVLAAWTKPKPPTPAAMDKALAPTRAALPERLADAVALDTGAMQADGWSAPPAAGLVLYHRAPLSPLPRQRLRRPAAGSDPTVARFVLAGRPRPRVEDTLPIAELMRLATMAQFHGAPVPAVFSGRDTSNRPLSDDPAHGHAFWLPQDADGDGLIDHMVVYAADGFDAEARRALDAVTRLWQRDRRASDEETPTARREWRLALEGFGTPADFAREIPFLATSAAWESVTPFLAAGHLKRGGYAAEVRRLLLRRGLVPAEAAAGVEVQVLDEIVVAGRPRRPLHFHRFRARRGEARPDSTGAFLRVLLPEPLPGPMALGHACHFGLGHFRPIR